MACPREVQNKSQQKEWSCIGNAINSLVIRQTIEASILTQLLPHSQIDIFLQVLQDDGGTRSACINAATLALSDAGITNATPRLDLNYVEDSAGGAEMLPSMDAKLPMESGNI
ncbi:unnamed protein product [Eruca vesicaria subsp. sativa]|uniref:Exoribonuclease phosphorolytic domain-containing protein n=1 Tax=Eruca vesicaria subsp. sativa TaxID=29727 RepID=A0ABC8J9P5_ERUVS|nr:unnamed protein product [Eruca vesicaria subsp. sativa]